MPCLTIETNVKRSDVADLNAALKELSAAVAASVGKPEQYVMVKIQTDQALIFGGTNDPCASATLMSIGKLGPEENKAHAAAIYPIVNKHLGVPEDRMYIHFQNAQTSEVAWKSTTFQQILGK